MATPLLQGSATTALSSNTEQLAEETGPIPDCRDLAPKPGIETENAPGGVEREEEHHDRKEYVGPRPFRRSAGPINPEPEVQHEYDCKRADQAHAESEDQRDREGELGQKDDGIEDVEVGKIEARHQLTMELER